MNCKNKDEWTLLHFAAYNGELEIVKYLIQHGSEVDAKNSDGLTPVYYTSEKRNSDVEKYLIQHGANVKYHAERLYKQGCR